MKKKWWLLLVLILICLIGGGWFYTKRPVVSTSKQPTYVEKSQVHLVAVGDSLTYGQGDEKKDGGYVGIIKGLIENKYKKTTVETKNYGVSGNRSDQILARLNSQAQMRADLKKADVITMTVGGNDLRESLEENIFYSPKTIEKNIDKEQTVYAKKLHKLLNAVRAQNSTAPVFIISIYNPVYTYFPDADAINSSVDKLNTTTQNVMKDYHSMYFVDINHLMSWGQYKTAEQRQALIDKEHKANQGKVSQTKILEIMEEGNKNLNKYISTEDNFHPNHLGYEQMANSLFSVMKDHDSWEYVKR
ncbi:MAG: SGNH/GDSL hydrolase family protein [Limosilactobacillus sp.]|uniref:SGNH/GDSL hydrolase family protein n=1 Tax=Limosilactobacillus sp. TaxID=2773925 RepID=UPI002700A6D2|nr:SGNH/GDSL hydrolase family protein [Limosilactobacillus sp.]